MFYLIFILGLICSVINDKRKIIFIFFSSALAILAYLRYGIGADFFAYQYLYSRLSDSLITELYYGLDNQELGFRLIGSFFKSLNVPYQGYISIIASINLFFVFKTCKNFSKNPTLSMLLYFCFYYLVWTFSGLRQGLTLSIGIYYLLKYINNRKIIKFTSIIILLSFIHTSVLILLPLYLFAQINFKKTHLIVLSFFSIIISMLPLNIIISKLFWLPFVARVIPYLDDSFSLFNILDFQSLGRIFFLLIVLIFYYPLVQDNENMKKIINIFVFGIIIYFLLKFSELTAARLSIYGKMLDIILLPNIYYLLKENRNKLLYSFFIVILCFAYLNKELITLKQQAQIVNNSTIAPYINIFNSGEYMFEKNYYYLE